MRSESTPRISAVGTATPRDRFTQAEVLPWSGYTDSHRDIRFWVLHSTGRRVIERAKSLLGLSDRDLRFSRRILRNFGNMSSATVLFVLDAVLRSKEPRPGDWGMLAALGPGFAAEGILLRW